MELQEHMARSSCHVETVVTGQAGAQSSKSFFRLQGVSTWM